MKKDYSKRRFGMALVGILLGYIFGGILSVWVYEESKFMGGFILLGTIFASIFVFKAINNPIKDTGINNRAIFDKILTEEGINDAGIRNEIWNTRPPGNLEESALRKLAQGFIKNNG